MRKGAPRHRRGDLDEERGLSGPSIADEHDLRLHRLQSAIERSHEPAGPGLADRPLTHRDVAELQIGQPRRIGAQVLR
jgi:hypothetical protein